MLYKKFNKKVYLKADASSEIGYGHFIRTLALADMLKDDFDCTFFTSDPNEYQKGEVAKVCNLHPLTFASAQDDFLQLLSGDEIVVLDNYYYTSEYQKAIKDKGCKLVCIDDIHDKHYYADIVINHAPGSDAGDYSCEEYTHLLLGPSYLLLRKSFFDIIDKGKEPAEDCTFICFGGSDENNLTLRACQIIRGFDTRKIIAVVGGGYIFHEELAIYAEGNDIEIHRSVNAETMASLMKSSTLAIVPSSCTFLEACCSRIPIITGYDVDNQIYIAASCERLGLGYNCGNLMEDFDQKLSSALRSITSDMSVTYCENQRRIVNSSKNILINEFKKL